MSTLIAKPGNKEPELVLEALRKHKSMPLLELTSITGIKEDRLEKIIIELSRRRCVKVSHPEDILEMVVTLDSKLW
jgi:hypothetical protein